MMWSIQALSLALAGFCIRDALADQAAFHNKVARPPALNKRAVETGNSTRNESSFRYLSYVTEGNKLLAGTNLRR